jgi:CO/xanthine dehydrogenase FAD-binding subunit
MMPKSIREYHRPTDLTSAQELLRRPLVAPLLLGPRVPDNLYEGTEAVVDLSQLDLNYIRPQTDGSLAIGALTPLSVLINSTVLHAYASGVLAEAARVVVASGLREVATIGGAWLSQAGPPEVRLVLEALQVNPVLEQALPMEIKLPPLATGSAVALERLTRAPRDEAIVAVVAVIDGAVHHAAASARLCVGPAPYHCVDVLSNDVGQALDGWQPISDFRASANYRKAMANVLAHRTLETAYRRSTQNR